MKRSLSVTVAGATGNQGGAVARHLVAQGHRVLGLSRRSDGAPIERLRDAGVKVRVADLERPTTLAAAVSGADAVFVVATPFETGVEGETRQAHNLVGAALAAGVPHVVYSSVASADRGTGVPHFESKFAVEEHLRAAGAPFTIVAPAAFMEMAIAPWALPGLRQGSIGEPLPSGRPVQRVALDDLGAFVALVIGQRDRFLGKRIEIAGDELTGLEQAAQLSRHVGRDLRYVELAPEFAGSDDLRAMFQFMTERGYQVDIGGLQRTYPQIAWHDFETWAAEQDWPALLAAAMPAGADGGRA